MNFLFVQYFKTNNNLREKSICYQSQMLHYSLYPLGLLPVCSISKIICKFLINPEDGIYSTVGTKCLLRGIYDVIIQDI